MSEKTRLLYSLHVLRAHIEGFTPLPKLRFLCISGCAQSTNSPKAAS